MEVNLENLFVAIGVKRGYTPSPPPQLVRPLILLSKSDLLHSKNIFTIKFRTPWTAPYNFQQHALEPIITIPMN